MPRIPTYGYHKNTGRGRIRYKPLFGPDGLLLPGKYNSLESLAAFQAAMSRVLEHMRGVGQSTDSPRPSPSRARVAYLVESFLPWSAANYGEKEHGHFRMVSRLLLAMHEQTKLTEFGPLALKGVREAMIEQGWSRNHVNKQVNRIVRMFKWAVAEEMLDASVVANLAMVPGLRKGKTKARETERREPVEWPVVLEVMPHLTPMLRAMVEVHYLTGMRSDELTGMRPCEMAMNDAVWVYAPAEHKTAWRLLKKFICIGPQAQALLGPYLPSDPAAYFFTPAGAIAERTEARIANRKTKKYGTPPVRPPRKVNPRYAYRSYHRAIVYGMIQLALAKSGERGCRLKHGKELKAWLAERGVEYWTPHQLRHARATVTENEHGIEAAAAITGNSLDAAKLYTWTSLKLARSIALESG